MTYGYGYGYTKKCSVGKIIDSKHKHKYDRRFIPIQHQKPIWNEGHIKHITNFARKKNAIIYGSHAFNAQVPEMYKKKPHTDIDMLISKNKTNAIELEKSLDNRANCNQYFVSELKCGNESTYRVKNKAWWNSSVSDLSKINKIPPFTRIGGVRYETIDHREKEVRRMLRDPGLEHRREKDRKMLRTIERYKRSL